MSYVYICVYMYMFMYMHMYITILLIYISHVALPSLPCTNSSPHPPSPSPIRLYSPTHTPIPTSPF